MTLTPDQIRERYTKYEYRIPMRDGVRLFTSVLAPKDSSTTYPILLTRTPFGVSPYGPDEYGEMTLQTQAHPGGRLHLRAAGRARPPDVGG